MPVPSEPTIPVLNLEDFRPGGPQEAAFIAGVGAALSDTGFFSVVEHGVDREVISAAYCAAESFFDLPEEIKRRYEDPALHGQRGYTSFGREHARGHSAPDLKEFWHVGRERPAGAPASPDYPENPWPSEAPEFREALSALYRQLDACALRLLEAISLYVGESRQRLRDMAENGNSILRVAHYPPTPAGVDSESIRAAPHEDINLITLLCEATAGGLELRSHSGEWLPIQARRGEIVVDAGDMLQNVTNGLLRSTTHRVVNPANSRERRLSMPFFAHARPEVSVGPLPGCVARTGGVRRYQDITAGAFLADRLKEIGLK